MAWHHHQAYATIPNNVPWYWHVVIVLAVGALISHGVSSTVDNWRVQLKWPKSVKVVEVIAGIVTAGIAGVVLGHMVWSWSFGLVVALCGALSSRWLLSFVKARFAK